MLAAGVDLGATYIRCMLAENGRVLAKGKERTAHGRSIPAQISRMVKSLVEKAGVKLEELQGIGIASAGPLDLRRGGIVNSPNLGVPFLPLVKPVESRLGIKAYLLNDCVAGAIGEWKFGAGRGVNDLVYITISTGIGAGVIVDGHVLMGKDGNAHEIGHTVIDFEGRLVCGDGKRGHWEAYCSGRNIPNYVRMRISQQPKEFEGSWLHRNTGGDLRRITTEELFRGAKQGDKFCLRLVRELGELNAIGVANAVNAYDPALVSLGGSVVLQNRQLVLGPIRRGLKKYVLNRPPKIVVTPLGEDVVLHGAVAAVLEPQLIQRGVF
ncbi:MAG: ROK family protein [Candidatus Hadarchaeales archaeon]